MESFSRVFTVIWADLDPNRHMRHSAYNDYAAQLRLEYFTSVGLDLKELMKLGVGPILFREETRFFKEVHMSEKIEVSFALKKSRRNGTKWTIEHEILKESGELACTIEVDGAWLDLNKRKTTVPPQKVIDTFDIAPKTKDFEWLPDKQV